jgi:tRNA-dihydrouridine synthase B
LWGNEKNHLKQMRPTITGPQVSQIAGSEPEMLSKAAQLNERLGADAIDINMGCPAKTVLKKAAGSALLKDLKLVETILKSVVNSVSIPVTLKIRTGWSPKTRNGVEVARLAQDCGIRLLTVHGRTKECRFKGEAEYETIAEIKQNTEIPIIANGDIHSPQKAKKVLDYTKVDGLMIGRSALGKPWIFDQIYHYLVTGLLKSEPSILAKQKIIESHLKKIHTFYGETKGVWYARKHIIGYLRDLPNSREFWKIFNKLKEESSQFDLLRLYFENLAENDGAMTA